MIESERGGKIVNIASLLSFQGGITVPAYASVKRWRRSTHQSTRKRVGQTSNQRQCDSRQGYMRTTNTAALQADETRNRQILERIPAGRWGEASDVAGAAALPLVSC
jgi:2-deoxy-D-gluconate 3-dehydrogenase